MEILCVHAAHRLEINNFSVAIAYFLERPVVQKEAQERAGNWLQIQPASAICYYNLLGHCRHGLLAKRSYSSELASQTLKRKTVSLML